MEENIHVALSRWHQRLLRTPITTLCFRRPFVRNISRNTGIANGLRASKKAENNAHHAGSHERQTNPRLRRRSIASRGSPASPVLSVVASRRLNGSTSASSPQLSPTSFRTVPGSKEEYKEFKRLSEIQTSLDAVTKRHRGDFTDREAQQRSDSGSKWLSRPTRSPHTRRSSSNNEAKPQFGSRPDQEFVPRSQSSKRILVDGPITERPLAVPYATAASVLIPGMRPVMAALTAKRRQLYKLYIAGQSEKKPGREEILHLAEVAGIPIVKVSSIWLNKVATQLGADASIVHDGVLLDASPLPQIPIESLGFFSKLNEFFDIEVQHQSKEDAIVNGTPERLKYNRDGWRQPFVIWLHEVVDTQNVGAIARTALFLGADAIILSKRGTGTLSDTGAQKASAGASEFIRVLTVENPEAFMHSSISNGWEFYAAVAPNPDFTFQPSYVLSSYPPLLVHPTVLLVGNEDKGLPKSIARLAQHRVAIPGFKTPENAYVESLNVSAATAILLDKCLERPHSTIMAKHEAMYGNLVSGSRIAKSGTGDALRPSYTGAPRLPL